MRAATICAQPGCPHSAVRKGRCREHQRAHGATWRRLREDVCARAAGRCERCGTLAPLQVHHRDPVAQGGAELVDPGRLLALCRECHRREHGVVG
jgi:5-methylcytosine-specific restriction endonuclease McrA